MLTRYNATLYFDSIQNAMDAGYCDAQPVDDDIPELGYMAVISFSADGYEVEPAEDDFDIVTIDEDSMEFIV